MYVARSVTMERPCDTAVRSAFERGYDLTLVADGHTTFDTPTLDARTIVAHHNRLIDGPFAAVKLADAIQFD